METTTKFNLGDRVTDGAVTGTVDEISQKHYAGRSITNYHFVCNFDQGIGFYWRKESELEAAELGKFPKYTKEEAFVKAASLIGREVALNVYRNRDGEFVISPQIRLDIEIHACDILRLAMVLDNDTRKEVVDLIELARLDTIEYEARR